MANANTKTSRLPNPSTGNDSGGVAARQGFDFQDHCAATFFIELLEGKIDELYCEKSDDIQICYLGCNEYIQVKTTDGDRKWSVTEICTPKKGATNSIYTGSLIYDNDGKSKFRIITIRKPDKNLAFLTIPFEERSNGASKDKLIKTIKRISRNAVSSQGNGADYWVENCVWEVFGSAEALSSNNQKRLFKLISDHGGACFHDAIENAYKEIVQKVYDAAKASKVRNPSRKKISKQQAKDWLISKIEDINKTAVKSSKPYQRVASPFLIEFHKIDERTILRNLSGVEVGYDNQTLRTTDLVNYLKEWFPEFALKASDIANIGHTTFLSFFKKAIDAVKERKLINGDAVLGEILLHVCIRQFLHSEPIVGTSHYQGSDGKVVLIPNIHITHEDSKTQLWIGTAELSDDGAFDSCAKLIINQIDDLISKNFLERGRNMIITFSEPQYYVPNDLDQILGKNVPISRFAERLCIPIMIGYNSQRLSSGYANDYLKHLTEEVANHYSKIKTGLPKAVANVKVHIFLLPLESTKALIQEFNAAIS